MGIVHLSDRDRKSLHESGILDAVIDLRRYFSAEVPDQIASLGFAGYQCLPGMGIPITNCDGVIWTYHLRPYSPRIGKNGKPVKYEMRAGDRFCIDVPMSMLEIIRDPSIELWITEGAKKVDAAISHGIACIGLLGVWAWLGRNKYGGKTTLSDWREIALNNRSVVICYDSDVTLKPSVRGALDGLADMLERRGARVRYALLPHGPAGKVGLDDFLYGHGTVADLRRTIRDHLPPPFTASPRPIANIGNYHPTPIRPVVRVLIDGESEPAS